MSSKVELRILDPEVDRLPIGSSEYRARLAQVIDQAAERYADWVQNHLGGRPSALEMNAVKTFIYSLTKDDFSTLPRKKVDVVDSVIAPVTVR